MSASECQVFGCLHGNRLQNFQFESPKMKLCEFVRVPTVSDWDKFAVQIWKDEAPVHIANSRAFVYFRASVACPPRNFENSQHLSNFEQKTSPEVVNNSRNEATSRVRILFLFALAKTLVWRVCKPAATGWSGIVW